MPARHRIGVSMVLRVAAWPASLVSLISLTLAGCAGIGVGVAGASGQGFGVGLSLSPDALFRRSSPTGAVVPPPRFADPSIAPVPPIAETFESASPATAR
ncbi:hypothetical protein H7F36_08135 [Variovorax sp. PAMC28562]|uniref:hypothetical protein n=1 Tax=Variovorax sp. PAMC28562 TaxID=2762323 RepID=UPI00164CFB1B|nr:hypothetical protein [Variovorax sp. PAMC28562]QNK75154.1 hypothetical protein H7F36_08135 [Variovorax sp. PAMC28562]